MNLCKYKYIVIVIVIVIVIFIKLKIYELDLKTIDIKSFFTHNEIATYNSKVHNNLFRLLPIIKNKINILEIGAGNGISTTRFMNYLNRNNISYNYTICEVDKNYKNILNYKFNNKSKIYIDSWENLPIKYNDRYDLIFTTSLSTLNYNNFKYFKLLLNKNNLIITLHRNLCSNKLKKLNLKIIKKKKYGHLFLNLYLLKLL